MFSLGMTNWPKLSQLETQVWVKIEIGRQRVFLQSLNFSFNFWALIIQVIFYSVPCSAWMPLLLLVNPFQWLDCMFHRSPDLKVSTGGQWPLGKGQWVLYSARPLPLYHSLFLDACPFWILHYSLCHILLNIALLSPPINSFSLLLNILVSLNPLILSLSFWILPYTDLTHYFLIALNFRHGSNFPLSLKGRVSQNIFILS